MIDVTGLRDIRRESPGEFYLAVITAAAVVAIGVEQGILLAIALSLFRHVRHSYRPHTMMLAPDATGRWAADARDAGQGDRTGADRLSFRCGSVLREPARFADEVRALVEHAPTPVRWFIVDAGRDHRYRLFRRAIDARFARRSGAPRRRHGLRAVSVRTCAPTWTGTASRRWSARRGFSRPCTKPSPRCATMCPEFTRSRLRTAPVRTASPDYCCRFSQRMTTSGISDLPGRGSHAAPVSLSVLGD